VSTTAKKYAISKEEIIPEYQEGYGSMGSKMTSRYSNGGLMLSKALHRGMSSHE
jgi:hypothetical protein